ncbi:oligopeptidase A [Thiohalobacter thiocyanaticus]|uniref:oligopeptidase A n=1 Tax=Thiohalobacter thiocyanaticus TaxID=585455 RepID=A0A426QJG7_9GAMM|nr:oligopeptidase A [Thiohalobacter thiocyanaticus]RRQ21856.1 oligopeptidase A [Thiohalobacter thiocyanaticus]
MTNPLIDLQGLPPFGRILPEHVEPAIDSILADCRTTVQRLLDENSTYSWNNLVQPLEDAEDRLDRAWSPVSHMNSVVNSEELRQSYNACLPKLSDYATEMGQNERLYAAFQQIADSDEYPLLDTAQRKVIDNALRDFRLSGVALPPGQRDRYRAIMQELSSLTAKFEENLLDATHAWKLNITDENRLAGLPESAVDLARQTAGREGLEGWVFNLEFPSYYPVLTYADDRELRRELYSAYVTRASDEGPNAGQWDNGPVMEKILALRHEVARLLGFDNYAEKSIETKMAQSTGQVLQFLNDLAERALPAARAELDEVRAFARDQHGMDNLEAWDIAYYSEKLRQHKYAISQEELKPWFPVTRVIPGMFAVVQRLYGLDINEVEGVDAWHPDVRFYEIRDADGRLRGQFYLDLYARPHKRGGAWMDECISRRITRDGLQTPVAYLTCNFTPPVGDKPALLTHDEVITLFHEFGHGLHHMLTQVDYAGVSGISGVAWDAVELPSQFMENWCWEREALDLIAGHYETGEKLPGELFERMLAAKNFQAAMMMVRQLEFSIFDFRLHREYDPDRGGRVYEILQEVRDQVAVMQPPSFNRFPHSFSHIFAGGYAAGYYSYKWAEVLSADAFSAFEESGVFDHETGRRFLTSILEQGGSREPMELFIEFRGREPSIDALLRHSGLAA